jgi:hypothetical protein
MPTIDFLPYADAPGANVVDQATYAGEATTTTGFISGIAYSNECNKVWRQSSVISAAVARAIAQTLNIDVLDNGDVPTIVNNLLATFNFLAEQQVKIALATLGSKALVFPNPGTYTVTLPATTGKWTLIGGGGGAGADGPGAVGGGGGGGAVVFYYLDNLTVGATLNLTVGSPGIGGVGTAGNGGNATATILSSGSQTIFPATAGGGHGGLGGPSAPAGLGGSFSGGTFGSIGNGGGFFGVPGIVGVLGPAWGSGGGEFFYPDLGGLPGIGLFEYTG